MLRAAGLGLAALRVLPHNVIRGWGDICRRDVGLGVPDELSKNLSN